MLYLSRACGICVPFWLHSFRSVSYLDRTNTSFHLHYKHTPQHRTALGKYSFPFRKLHSFRFPTSLFQRIPNGNFLFSAVCLPQNSLIFPTTQQKLQLCKYIVLYFNVLAAGYFHSLLTIRGRQFVPHRHPPSLQSFITLHQLQHPAALVKNILAKRSVFYPCTFPYFPMVYLLQLRRVYPKNILNISPPPFSCCSSVRQ